MLYRRFVRWGLPAVTLALVAVLLTVWIRGSRSQSRDVPRLQRVVLIVLENRSYQEVIGNRSAPALNTLARRYALLTRYFALAHPSLPNYLALVSGSTHGVAADCLSCAFTSRNLADTIAASHRTWKVYAEGLPAPGFDGDSSGLYVKRHNPFLYFRDIASRPERLNRVVPLSAFNRDLEHGDLPDFSFVEPNLCHSMHDCALEQGDKWLGTFLQPLLAGQQLDHGAVFVTFDESNFDDTAAGGGHIATIVLGPEVRPGARTAQRLTHYSLLRTIEDAWDLPPLGRSRTALPILGIWRY